MAARDTGTPTGWTLTLGPEGSASSHDVRAIEFGDVTHAHERQSPSDLLAENLENMRDAVLTANRQSVHVRSTDSDRSRSECKRLHHVAATTNATVQVDGNAAGSAHSVDHRRKSFEARQCAVELASP